MGDPVSNAYAERATGFARDAERLGARSRLLANLRGLSFAVVVVAGGFVLFGHASWASFAWMLAGLVAFLGFVTWHSRVLDAEDEALRWERVNRDAEARTGGRWHALPEQGARYADSAHPYASDLDLFGSGSLFQRICVAHTRFGQDMLAAWLSEPAGVAEVLRRQAAVAELAPQLELRQRLEGLALATVETPPTRVNQAQDRAAAGRVGAKPKPPPNPEPLLEWAESEPRLSKHTWVIWLARGLPIVAVGLAGLGWTLGLALPFWLIPVAFEALLGLAFARETTRVFVAVSATEGAFLRYGAMLELLERLPAHAPLLEELRRRMNRKGVPPSVAMRDFRNAVSWFDLRHSALIHPFVNALTGWDIHCVARLESWQRRSGKTVRAWFTALGELEALCCFAGLAHDEPDFCFPEVSEELVFEAHELGHPLIDAHARVCNSVSLPGAGTALLITGSNMSGKSTMMRAIGLAAVMTLAGAPTCARRLRLGDCAVRTSIRVSDSLERGVSHFYAELKRLKAVVDATRAEQPVLFLLDEILQGTNSRERQIGARWVFAELLRRGALGAVSTHDMGLAKLPEALAGRMTLVHFRENVHGDRMTFDYQLRPGPVDAGNALRLMRLMGLEVPLD